MPANTPAGPITVAAYCNFAQSEGRADAHVQGNTGAYLINQQFTVTAVATTTTHTTATAPSTTTPSSDVSPPVIAPALPPAATPAQPTFTG